LQAIRGKKGGEILISPLEASFTGIETLRGGVAAGAGEVAFQAVVIDDGKRVCCGDE
jgi:hypothetical protein